MRLITNSWPCLTFTAIILWSFLALLSSNITHLPPLASLGILFLIGSLLSIKSWRIWIKDVRLLCIGSLGIFGYHYFLFLAFRKAPIVQANLINYLWPVFIVMFSPLFFKGYKWRFQHAFGTACAFFGAGLAIADTQSIAFNHMYWLGYLFSFCAAIIWALYSLWTKKQASMQTELVGGFCLVSSLLSFFLHGVFENALPPISFTDAAVLLVLGLGSMGIAFYAWDKALKLGDPRIIGSLSYLTPILSSFWLLAFGDKNWTPGLLISVFFVVLGGSINLGKQKINAD